MERLNPKQVEWLVVNQPETRHKYKYLNYRSLKRSNFTESDLDNLKRKDTVFYLYTETYNSLPAEFKKLADGN
jgi:hypothetical protein